MKITIIQPGYPLKAEIKCPHCECRDLGFIKWAPETKSRWEHTCLICKCKWIVEEE